MTEIEKQINRKNAINYIDAQFYAARPFPVDSKHQGQITLKLQSEHGATNWLNITPEDCQQIEAILLTSYLKRVEQ
jgi:hypothetical protein